ncbi:MAG: DUF2156 domain-containing protein [Ruminococcaceae bacterium]|nr:DUF2156 domain-containing protein [Oscillospiraceae bacterium]
MIERKEIDIEARSVFKRYIKNQDNSTYNHTNMFMWSRKSGITYAVTEGCLALFFQFGRQPVSVSFPMGDGDRRMAVRSLSAYIKEQGLTPVFRNLSASMAKELCELFPNCFELVEDRSAADYIYETESLIHLNGKKLHAKRNHLNYFKKNYLYQYKRLEQADMPDCLELFDRWVEEKSDMRWLSGSREATVRLLENFERLPVRGGGIYVDNRLVAFSIGEAMTEDTVLIHLEFAADLRGAFNVINSEFCANEWSAYPFVNREEDMGLPGLRQAKLAYRPVRLLTKYNAVQKVPIL